MRRGVKSSALGIPTKVFQFAIRIDSIRYANRFESIRFVKNRFFDSLIVMQFFLLIYCIVSAKKYTTMHAIESYTV